MDPRTPRHEYAPPKPKFIDLAGIPRVKPPEGILPGDWAVVSTAGTGGYLISIGEWANGNGFGPWDHAFVYLGGGMILQAEPGGSRINDLGTYGHIRWAHPHSLTPDMRARVPEVAHELTGIPYSSADYFALAAHRLHLWAPGLKHYVASTGHMICSQLVDEFCLRLGLHLFGTGAVPPTHGVWPGYVTPAMLAALANTDAYLL